MSGNFCVMGRWFATDAMAQIALRRSERGVSPVSVCEHRARGSNNMIKTLKTRLARTKCGLLAMIVQLVLAVPLLAQEVPPPPLGPPTFRSDKTQIAVFVITAIAKTKVAEIVSETNETIHKQTSQVTVEAMPILVFGPRRVATQHTNRPNEFFVKLPLMVQVKVKIRLASDRTISIPLDVNFSCEGWQTGNGNLQITTKTERAIIEGGNIVEDVLRVREIIDSLIRSKLAIPTGFPVPSLPISSCVTLGASPGRFPGDPVAFIAYDQPGPTRLSVVAGRLAPMVEVTLLKLKRLRARSRDGSVLYQPTENIVLETYANFTTRQSAVLTMREDQEVALDSTPLIAQSSGLDSLVLIANINQQPLAQPQDSAFAVWRRTANFGVGTHTLQITKVFTIPPGPTNPKPLKVRVPAYELTYSVRVNNRVTIR